jgi:hypothetical protein
MFSYFNGGIKNIYPKRHIDFISLIRLIKNNPEKPKIEKVREFRKVGNDYNNLKNTLPYITPNCMVKVRKLKDSDYNLIAPSTFIYFDIDDYPNSKKLKDRVICEYGHLASLICISCSGGGISIFFKVSNHLKTEEDFLIARQYIIDNILVNEEIDTNAGGIARAMFISSDPDLFFSYENEIVIPIQLFKINKQKVNTCLMEVNKTQTDMIHIDCAPQEHFVPTPIKEVLAHLILETPVHVDNPVVDFKEIDFVEIRFSYLIKDGLKHRTFTDMIHKLIFLNPKVDRQYLLSYIYHVNEEYTGYKKMELRELIGLFNTVYNGATFLGNSKVKPKLKRIHYNKDCGKSFDKRKVSGRIRGAFQENETKLKIRMVIEEMKSQGLLITKSSISKFSGIHRGTISKHLNSDLNDIEALIIEINDSIQS